MTTEERFVCNQQKELYEYVQEAGGDVFAFSDVFLKSRFCNQSLDKPYSVDQFADVVNWIEFLELEGCSIEGFRSETNYISREVAGWLGFTYRQLHYAANYSGKRLANTVPPKLLAQAYPGLHTVDEDVAADIIISDFGLQPIANETVNIPSLKK